VVFQKPAAKVRKKSEERRAKREEFAVAAHLLTIF